MMADSDRLVRVLATQVDTFAIETVADWQGASSEADAIAIAPYFGYELGSPRKQARTARMRIRRLFRKLERKSLSRVFRQISESLQLANSRGLPLMAYEGGQHLAGYGGGENNRRLTRKFIRANRDARMHDLYLRYLEYWLQNGGGLFAMFSHAGLPGKWGSWGLLEHYFQMNAPKYTATMEILDRYQ
jgi:hypothetical protein